MSAFLKEDLDPSSLKILRRECKMTITDLARFSGLSASLISKIENGKVPFSDKAKLAIFKALNYRCEIDGYLIASDHFDHLVDIIAKLTKRNEELILALHREKEICKELRRNG